jgi:flagellar basal-body rod protein FlgB
MRDGLKILEGLIKQASMRHGVISSNIANVDTPNYKAQDLKFGRLLDDATMELTATHAGHLAGSSSGASGEAMIETTRPWADKNNVELDVEVAKMTENSLFFQAGITMLSTKIRMFKNALRRQL